MSRPTAILLGASSFFTAAAAAQEPVPAITGAAETTLEDEAPLKVPEIAASVTSLTGLELEDRFLTEPVEIARQAPNTVAALTPGFGSGNFYVVRGLSNVGTYVDGVRLSDRSANHFGLLDIETVRVVRGPAPLAHALPSGGGGLHVRLHRPGEETHGEFEGYFGKFDRKALRGSLDIPSATGVFALNLSGYYQDTDGYADNLATGEKVNEEDRWGGRLGFRLSPANEIDLHFGAAFLHDEALNLLNFECGGETCDDRFAATGFPADPEDPLNPLGLFPAGDGFIRGDRARIGLGNEADIALVTSDLEWRAGFGTLRLVSGYVDTDQLSAIDFGSGPGPGTDLRIAEEERREFTNDLSLGRTFGEASSLRIGVTQADTQRRDEVANVVADPSSGEPVNRLAFDRTVHANLSSISVYAEGDARLAAFELSGGLRYADQSVDARLIDAGARPHTRSGFDHDVWSGFVQARFALTGETTLFARAARGYTAGDLGAAVAEPETNWTYEGGVEAGFLGGRGHLRLTGFYLQADDAAQLFAAGGRRQADVSNLGVEAEIGLAPFEDLRIEAAAGYQNAKYEEDSAAGLPEEPAYAPDLTATAWASYDVYLRGAESFLTPSVGIDYRSEMNVTEPFLSPLLPRTREFGNDVEAGGRLLVNAGLTLRTDDDWWLVSVKCDNCLDETYVDSSFGGLPYLGRPMSWTIRARRQF